jgi:branched-chain amino acid transport system permease protein
MPGGPGGEIVRHTPFLRPLFLYRAFVLALCAFMPGIAPLVGEPYWTDIFLRIMIWAIAAVGLDLILGFGGMVSFGHAMFIGIGGYTVGILAYYEIFNGFVQWPLALVISGTVAAIVGAICLRTRGIYFIMITLAFGQMIYFLAVSAEEFGSDDGLVIEGRSEFAVRFGETSLALDLGDPMVFYYLVFVILVAVLWIVQRIVNSRFGAVIKGVKSNEGRMAAIGFDPFRYKLVCFIVAGMIGGLAGVLMANGEKYISPDMMHWTKSGELIFMVVLGGMATVFGPVTGAVVFLFLSEILSNITQNWHLIFGPFLVLVVLFARRGIDGLFAPKGGADA